jgi:hypothetical protein
VDVVVGALMGPSAGGMNGRKQAMRIIDHRHD